MNEENWVRKYLRLTRLPSASLSCREQAFVSAIRAWESHKDSLDFLTMRTGMEAVENAAQFAKELLTIESDGHDDVIRRVVQCYQALAGIPKPEGIQALIRAVAIFQANMQNSTSTALREAWEGCGLHLPMRGVGLSEDLILRACGLKP